MKNILFLRNYLLLNFINPCHVCELLVLKYNNVIRIPQIPFIFIFKIWILILLSELKYSLFGYKFWIYLFILYFTSEHQYTGMSISLEIIVFHIQFSITMTTLHSTFKLFFNISIDIMLFHTCLRIRFAYIPQHYIPWLFLFLDCQHRNYNTPYFLIWIFPTSCNYGNTLFH